MNNIINVYKNPLHITASLLLLFFTSINSTELNRITMQDLPIWVKYK